MARRGVSIPVSNAVCRRWLNESMSRGTAYTQSSKFVPEKRTESLLSGVLDGKRAKLAEAITLGKKHVRLTN